MLTNTKTLNVIRPTAANARKSCLSLAWEKKNCFNEKLWYSKSERSLEVLTIIYNVPIRLETFIISVPSKGFEDLYTLS